MASNFPVSSFQKSLESKVDLLCPLKAKLVHTLRLKACFLHVFLSCRGKHDIEDTNLQALLIRIRSVFQSADQDLAQLWRDYINISSEPCPGEQRNADDLLSNIQERLEILNQDVQQVHTILHKSSRSVNDRDCEAATESLRSLLDNLEDLLRCNSELVAPVKEELEAVQKTLRFLRNFLRFTARRCSELQELKDLIAHAEFLAGKMSSLLYLCCVNDKMNDQMADEMKMRLSSELEKFSSAQPDVREIYTKALKASRSAKGYSAVVDEFDLGFVDSLRDDILELSNTNPSFMTSIKDQVLSQHEELLFLTTFFAVDKPSEEHSKHDDTSHYLIKRINAVVVDIALTIYELNMKVSDLAAIIMFAKEDARKMYDLYVPKSLRSDFPRTNGPGFIGSLLQNLNELVNTKPDLVAPLKHHVEIVRKELLSLGEDFGKIAKQPSQCVELQCQWNRFLDAAYQTEYVIESFLAGGDPIYCHRLGLFNVIEEIKAIKMVLKAIENKMIDDISLHQSPQISAEANFPTHNAELSSKERFADEESTSKLVIFEEEDEKIKEQLTNGFEKLKIISIVGMPGIGKTTLAHSVLKNSSIIYHFHVRARCSVSQVHDARRLLVEILQQVSFKKRQYRVDGDDLDKELYQSLKGRRYLILLDDIWNIVPWRDIKASLPDDKNGSRIIFTSRFDDIATRTGLESIKYRLSTLSEERCWEMLQVKLFGNESCPLELVSVGREIAASCKGLPLTVDLVAGVLRVKERKEWKKVSENLMTFLFEDPEGRCRKVLEFSYQHLPDDLKPCFLYFAAFREDENVLTRDLISLWIAEGFVQAQEGERRSLEHVAEDKLNNLISRSLAIVSRRRPLGGVEASRVHDLLREFAAAKAQEESFMLKLDLRAKFSTLPSADVHDRWQEQYRLCFYTDNWEQFLESKPSGPRTRTLICPSHRIQGSLHLNFDGFKLLRVLCIRNGNFVYNPAMLKLIHLRVLIIDRADPEIFFKIHELPKLETFIIGSVSHHSSEEPCGYLLLDEIRKMVRLRHFCFGGFIFLSYGGEKNWEKSFLFDNLQTLYHLRVNSEEDIEKISKLMPNLVNLRLFYDRQDGGCLFLKLDLLKKLESLEVTHYDYELRPYQRFASGFWYPSSRIFSFPPYLKKLVLSKFRMPWTEISEIGKLEYLEFLELRNGAFKGPIWDMIDGQFPKLKYLSLCRLDIKEWKASEDHLSCLEQLHLDYCWQLNEIPSCLGEIPTLQVIKLYHCRSSVVALVKIIKEDQEAVGNEQFRVDIQRR